MPEPISAPRVPPTLPEVDPRSAPAASASLDRIIDRVAVSVSASEGAPSCAAPARPDREQLGALRDAFRERGGAGLYALLEARPDVLTAVGTLSPEQLERELGRFDPTLSTRSMLPPWSAPAERIVAEVTEKFDGVVHGRTLLEGQRAVRDALGSLDRLGATLPAQLDALRRATPGSDEAVVASLLGVRGDVDDLARAQARVTELRGNLEAFATRLAGRTWTQSDFPAASARALESLGLACAPEGSIAALTAGEAPSATSEVISNVLKVVHVALGGLEAHHLLRAAGAAAASPAVGVVAAGLAFEAYIHHLNEESHAVFVGTGRLLGM